MLSNENFKRSAELCAKRDALLDLSKEVNDSIINPPMSEEELRLYFLNNHDRHIKGIIAFFLAFPLTIGCFFLVASIVGINSDGELLFTLFVAIASLFLQVFIFKKIENAIVLKKRKNDLIEQAQWRDKYYSEVLPSLQLGREEINYEIQRVNDELRSFDGIPETEWEIAGQLWYLFSTHQADSYKEALWLWNDIQHKMKMEAEASYQTQLAYQAMEYAEESKEYAYQAMIAAEQAESNSRMNLVLSAYNTYQISQLTD